VSKIVKSIYVTALCGALTACSSLSGDWPNLAEPYPDASERERVIEQAYPAEPISVESNHPLTRSTAFKLLQSTRARFETAKTEYLAITAELANLTGDEKVDLWNEAQLSLTRLSQTASRLDSITHADILKNTPVKEKATTLKNEWDVFLVTERKTLAARKP